MIEFDLDPTELAELNLIQESASDISAYEIGFLEGLKTAQRLLGQKAKERVQAIGKRLGLESRLGRVDLDRGKMIVEDSDEQE